MYEVLAMNWDRTARHIYRFFRSSPTTALAVAYIISRVPVSHCKSLSDALCSEMTLNLFVIEFPYVNIPKELMQWTLIFFILEAGVRIYIHFKTRKIRKQTKAAHEEIRLIEAGTYPPEEAQERIQKIKAQLNLLRKEFDDTFPKS